MLETIIIVLLLLWVLGMVLPSVNSRFPDAGGFIHLLLVIVIVVILLRVLGVNI